MAWLSKLLRGNPATTPLRSKSIELGVVRPEKVEAAPATPKRPCAGMGNYTPFSLQSYHDLRKSKGKKVRTGENSGSIAKNRVGGLLPRWIRRAALDGFDAL